MPEKKKRGCVFAGLKWVLTRKWLWAAVALAIVAVLAWRLYKKFEPTITSVSILQGCQDVTIEGKAFGQSQGESTLRFVTDDEPLSVDGVESWSGRSVTLAPPEADLHNASVQLVKSVQGFEWPSNAVPFVTQASGLPSEPYSYEVPVLPNSPWPTFRRDRRNTGRSPIHATYDGGQPWSFQTGKGIFSTPIIDGDGTVYVGSADHVFYALNRDGTEKWRLKTGDIIDSAGALHRADPKTGARTLTFISGDSYMYHLRTDGEFANAADRVLWRFDVKTVPGAGPDNWWEGNVAIGFDGTIYAGNSNFNYYAVNPDGTVKWNYATGSNAWSVAAFGDDSTIYWGSNDALVHAVWSDGTPKWTQWTLGIIAGSAAIGSDGTVYIGSFDSFLYALDSATGKVKWKFKTWDHIYSSPALGADAAGNTDAIYFGSTDGLFYALDPSGELLWEYDAGDPIRSSPALGRKPEGEQGSIVYFGCGNGKLYALNTDNGTRRWSFDTTPENPELRERNDLNGSPALGTTGVYFGGEHGYVWYVPYDYPLDANDPRCSTDPGEDLPDDTVDLFYVTPGGTSDSEDPESLPAATVITLRLVVRKDGKTVDARVKDGDSLRITGAKFPHKVEVSADGHYIHIVPTDFLELDTSYTLDIEGDYYTEGWDLGNVTVGGTKSGRFEDTFTFAVKSEGVTRPPLQRTGDRVSAMLWTRLAVPLPTMLPSMNQIGFDYMDWIVGTVELTEPDENHRGKCVLWAIGGRYDENGVLVPDPKTPFTLPLSGTYLENNVILTNKNFNMAITGVDIPFNLYQPRGRLNGNLEVGSTATVYADAKILSIPTFGPYLVLAGLGSNVTEKLVAMATYVTRAYDERGLANQRPEGVSVTLVKFIPPRPSEKGLVSTTIQLAPGATYPLDQHRPGILLIDPAQTAAVFLDYHANLECQADEHGNLATITLTIPPGTQLPEPVKAVVLLDVFPIHEIPLQ